MICILKTPKIPQSHFVDSLFGEGAETEGMLLRDFKKLQNIDLGTIHCGAKLKRFQYYSALFQLIKIIQSFFI